MALLGNVALLAGRSIDWDRNTMNIVGNPNANEHLGRQYREGWSL